MKNRFLKISLISLGSMLLFAFAFNGFPKVTETDRAYIDSFLNEWKIKANTDSIHRSFEAEFAFVSEVQDSLLHTIKSVQTPNENVGDLAAYYRHRSGICYDRAMILEKIFLTYGFDVRHIYVYFNNDSTNTGFTDFFKKGLNSHALLEVKTQRGWMVVGSNHNWIGLDANGNPLDLEEVRALLKQASFTTAKPSSLGSNFFSNLPISWNFRYAYGIYSRHGKFLKSPIEKGLNTIGIPSFVPDYNLRMLLYNF